MTAKSNLHDCRLLFDDDDDRLQEHSHDDGVGVKGVIVQGVKDSQDSGVRGAIVYM